MSGGPGGVPSTGPGGTLSDGPGGTPPRAPGGLPPRRPGARGARAAASGGRPPGSPGRSQRSRTRPADTRPPTAGPGRGAGPAPVAGPPCAPATGSAPEPATAFAPGRPTTAAVDGGPGTASAAARTASAASAPVAAPSRGRIAPGSHRWVARPSAAPVVPAQTPRRPVPQLRPTDHFAELLLGVLSGRRPVHSMLRHTVGRAYDDLAHLAERGPLRTRGTSPVVRDIGYFEPRPGALEVFARIGAGDRLRAMAFRLERGRDLRWRCTAVEVGGPRRTRADDD
ncbi:Rv3235 family protein [Streptomyces anthocyanicus]